MKIKHSWKLTTFKVWAVSPATNILNMFALEHISHMIAVDSKVDSTIIDAPQARPQLSSSPCAGPHSHAGIYTNLHFFGKWFAISM